MLQEQMVVNECYIMQNRIGEDTFTEHWKATAIFSATKFLLRFVKNNDNSAGSFDELRSEAIKCYRVSGQYIADFIEMDFFNKQLFISSEYNDETNLLSVLEKKKDWKLEQICKIIISLARGLASFHDQGIIYGNLNAENVLVKKISESNYSVKIQKPGLFSMLSVLPEKEKILSENHAYIAPEYKQRNELCEGSDVYSLGIHLVRFFTGRVPFSDSLQSLKSDTASLIFTTNSLLRRGVPERLVRITLRALLPDITRRYGTCIDMINDLRFFIESSELSLFDSVNYFKSLKEPVKDRESGIDVLYPVKTFNDQASVERLEKQELNTVDENELHWSIDDYIANGIHAITGEKGMNNNIFVRLPEKIKISVGEDILHTDILQEKTVFKTAGNPISHKNITIDKAPQNNDTGPNIPDKAKVSFLAINQVQVSGESLKKNISWNYHHVRFQDVRGIIEVSIKRAQKGKGCFRYIQEPPSAVLTADLFNSLETLKNESLYVNLGSCARYGKAGIIDFAIMLRQGLAKALPGETRNALLYLAHLVAKQDTFGVFKSYPVGRVLYGRDAEIIKEHILRTKKCQKSIVSSLLAFSRKKKPLVLVIRGGESIQKDLHQLLTQIAGGIHNAPVCVFVFYEHKRIEPWHALSTISKR